MNSYIGSEIGGPTKRVQKKRIDCTLLLDWNQWIALVVLMLGQEILPMPMLLKFVQVPMHASKF